MEYNKNLPLDDVSNQPTDGSLWSIPGAVEGEVNKTVNLF